ncbi:MAG TPA: hypothetical protein DCY25_10465 [Bacteroidales bacterium]|nr:hypothetical protein [Bacteroidales bacterium]
MLTEAFFDHRNLVKVVAQVRFQSLRVSRREGVKASRKERGLRGETEKGRMGDEEWVNSLFIPKALGTIRLRGYPECFWNKVTRG